MEDSLNFDGTVTIRHHIEYSETIPQTEYDIRYALSFLNKEEKEKVLKYITRLAKGRIPINKVKKKHVSPKMFNDKNIQ